MVYDKSLSEPPHLCQEVVRGKRKHGQLITKTTGGLRIPSPGCVCENLWGENMSHWKEGGLNEERESRKALTNGGSNKRKGATTHFGACICNL